MQAATRPAALPGQGLRALSPQPPLAPWQRLNLTPLPHQQGSLRPTLRGLPLVPAAGAAADAAPATAAAPDARCTPSAEDSTTLRTAGRPTPAGTAPHRALAPAA